MAVMLTVFEVREHTDACTLYGVRISSQSEEALEMRERQIVKDLQEHHRQLARIHSNCASLQRRIDSLNKCVRNVPFGVLHTLLFRRICKSVASAFCWKHCVAVRFESLQRVDRGASKFEAKEGWLSTGDQAGTSN